MLWVIIETTCRDFYCYTFMTVYQSAGYQISKIYLPLFIEIFRVKTFNYFKNDEKIA